MGLCPSVVFDCIATWASNSGSEIVLVLLGDPFPRNSCSFKGQWRNWNRTRLNIWSVHCPSAVCHSPRYSNYVVDGFFVPSTLTFQSSDFTSSEYTICIANDTFSNVVSHSKPNPQLLSGIQSVCGSVELCYGNTFSHMRQILVSASCHAVFRKASSRHDPF